jgi:hypothetical protein
MFKLIIYIYIYIYEFQLIEEHSKILCKALCKRIVVLPSCVIFFPSVGCFVLLMISRFSSFKSKVKILGKDFSMMYYTI